jgi:hypothetical protein
VACEDEHGTAAALQVLSVSVTPEPDVATIRSLAETQVEVGTPVTIETDEDTELYFVLEGADPDGEDVDFEWRDADAPGSMFQSAGSSLSLSLGELSVVLQHDNLAVARFVPNRDVNGLQTLEVRAAVRVEDLELPTAHVVEITIHPTNDPPEATPTPAFVAWVHERISNSGAFTAVDIPFAAFATDVDGDPLTVSTVAAPQGSTGNGQAGVGTLQSVAGDILRFTPTEEFIAATATISITDGLSEPVLHTLDFEGHGYEDCAAIRNSTDLETGVHLLDPGTPGDGDLEEPRYFAHCEMDSLGGGWTLTSRALGGNGTLPYDGVWWQWAQPALNPERPDYELSTGMLASAQVTEFNQMLVGLQSSVDERPRLVTADVEIPQNLVDLGVSELPSFKHALRFPTTPLITRTETGAEAEVRARWLGAVGASDADFPAACNEVAIRGPRGTDMSVRVGLLTSDTDCTTPTAYVGVGATHNPTAGGWSPDGFSKSVLGAIWVRGNDFSDDLPARADCDEHAAAGVKLDGTYPLDDGTTCDLDLLGNDSVCRDGIVEGIEAIGDGCDDGNGIDGDTCDSNCTVPSCGNGIISVDEFGNTETCDPPDPDAFGVHQSCDASCQIIGGAS